MKRFFLWALLLFSCMTFAAMPTALAADQGETVAIELPANPSTGYSWTYTFSEDNILKEDSSGYIPTPGKEETVGRGGKQVWIFRAVNPGSVGITFTYQRPWEAGAASSDSVTYFYAVDTSLAITLIGRSSSSSQSVRPIEDNLNRL